MVASASHRPDVVAVNDAARKRGIVPGLSIAAALALDPAIAIHLRDERAESHALKGIALWTGQWTSTISVEPPTCVLLEISGGLTYFGGLENLLGRIDAGLATLGFTGVIATAPTAGAASLFARAGQPIIIEEDAARRFGQALLDEVDCARGMLPDPRPPFVPPERYHGQLELPAPVDEAEALLFGIKRLVAELAGFLHGRGAGVTRLRCDLVHEDAAPTSIVLGLTSTRQVEHIMNVLRERLAREELPDRVEAIRIVSEETAPLGAKEGDFFPVAGRDGEVGAQLFERLRARLGEEAVQTLELRADHRPEQAWEQTTMIGRAVPALNHRGLSPVRPLWLFPSPKPLGADPAAAEVRLVSGPERIETGWWDGDDVGRDYFVGRNVRGEELWLYRDRGGEWFAHGVFA